MRPNEIIVAMNAEDYAAGKILIEEYAAAVGGNLCFQNFSEEMANLSQIYGPPDGCLLFARNKSELIACVAIRNQDRATCEMKRLYVKPQHRRTGLGRRLAESAMAHAQQLGYTRMVLDTLPTMTAAHALYASLGFREIAGYYQNPLGDVRFLACDLSNYHEPSSAED